MKLNELVNQYHTQNRELQSRLNTIPPHGIVAMPDWEWAQISRLRKSIRNVALNIGIEYAAQCDNPKSY